MTAPEPTVCPTCDGSQMEMRAVIFRDRKFGRVIHEEATGRPCRDCTCEVCGGRNTDTPPECAQCAAREEAAAKRSSDA